MLYDSAAQLEVRHVISLAHHTISLSEGSFSSNEQEKLRDGDLFIKRTAIVLTPTELPNGHLQSHAAAPKPFYLFSTLCSEKEDFYHALLYTRSRPPIPEPLDPNDAIKLQSTLHSTSLTPETRAFNALAGRIFLGIYHTPWLENLIQRKVEKKISRVQKPSFLANLTVKSVNLGDAAPVLSNPRLKDLNISGDMTIAFDVRYSGGIKLTISALAKLDLGPRFKTRTVDLVLATSLQRLQGHMLVRIKPPPSNRIWFCFETPPDMDVKVEPVVSQRKISYTFILRAIEDRIRAVFTETLVQPNWDDVPFFNTAGQNVRGGIWRDEGGHDELEPNAGTLLGEKNLKTKSMPALHTNAENDSSAASSGSETTSKVATGASTPAKDMTTELKRRSIASLPARSATNLSTASTLAAPPELPPSQPLRSPSFTSPSASQPSIALDESSARIDPNRAADAQGQPRRWRIRPAPPALPARREAVEAMREMRDRVLAHRENAEAEATQADVLEGVGNYVQEPAEDSTSDERPDTSDSRRMSESPAGSLKSVKRTDSTASSSTTRSSQPQKKTILAATAAATNAARSWSWNAIANARTKGPANHQRAASAANGQSPQQEPMGRGQPLPPPGTPLPGPQRGLFSGLGTVRRKPVPKTAPVLPPRRTETQSRDGEKSEVDVSVGEVEDEHEQDPHTAVSDEFGPWSQNSGLEGIDNLSAANAAAGESDLGEKPPADVAESEMDTGAVVDHAGTTSKSPPPLPPRRDLAESNTRLDDLINMDDVNGHATSESQHVEDRQTMDLGHHNTEFASSGEYHLDPTDSPPAESDEQAVAKFAHGADVHEADFDHDVARPESGDGEVNDADSQVGRDDDSADLVAIHAPVEDDTDGEGDDGQDISTEKGGDKPIADSPGKENTGTSTVESENNAAPPL
jgi:hypothetical protein